MTKSPEAFRTISEVADALDVPPHVLRFWETRFTQVKPVKRGGGRRYYRPEDVRLLRGIRGLLYDDGMTIKGVQKILRERGIRHVIGLGTVNGYVEEDAATSLAEPTPQQDLPVEPDVPDGANGHRYSEAPEGQDLLNGMDGLLTLTERPSRTEVVQDEDVAPLAAVEVREPAAEGAVEESEMDVQQEVEPAPVSPMEYSPAERRQALIALIARLKALREVMVRDA